MRKIVCILVMMVSLTLVVGCGQKHPSNINDIAFYNDMVKCIDYSYSALEYKSTNKLKNVSKLIAKYSTKDMLNPIDSLNDVEEEILINNMIILNSSYNYIKHYYDNRDFDPNALIDINTIEGNSLYKTFQETLSLLEIEDKYKLK